MFLVDMQLLGGINIYLESKVLVCEIPLKYNCRVQLLK